MLHIELSEKEVVMLRGILGVTSGMAFEDLFKQLSDHLNDDELIIADDMTDLIYEIIYMHKNKELDEDFLYKEAKKLNEPLD